jgi:hypothetical protein
MAGVPWLLGSGCAMGGKVSVLHFKHPKIWKMFSENIYIITSGSKRDYKITRCINWSPLTLLLFLFFGKLFSLSIYEATMTLTLFL